MGMCREVWKHGENLLANGERSSPEEAGGGDSSALASLCNALLHLLLLLFNLYSVCPTPLSSSVNKGVCAFSIIESILCISYV